MRYPEPVAAILAGALLTTSAAQAAGPASPDLTKASRQQTLASRLDAAMLPAPSGGSSTVKTGPMDVPTRFWTNRAQRGSKVGSAARGQ